MLLPLLQNLGMFGGAAPVVVKPTGMLAARHVRRSMRRGR